MKSRKKNKKRIRLLIIIISLFMIGSGSGLFLLYGPYNGFRDWLVTTAMTTMSHQYLATWFYSEERINEILANNNVVEPKSNTDTSLISTSEVITTYYKNEYEKQVLDREEGTLYKIIDIEGDGYSGYLAVVYDASKISVVTSQYLGTRGEYLVDMAKREGAVLAINGGGFLDIGGQGDGGSAVGIVIQDGIILQSTRGWNGGIVGFTEDNKLYLGKITANEAIELGIRDAVEFGPFLVVNGESSFINGNGGYGIHPRTAIGQRQDGIVLMLVIDGRRVGCMGADMNDLAEIMVRYGAYNAANLDGGNSSVMVVNDEIINHPINWDNLEQTRPIATGFIVVE